MTSENAALYFDATTLQCPLLFVKTKQWLVKLQPEQTLWLDVIDPLGINDIQKYLDKQGFEYTMGKLTPMVKSACSEKPVMVVNDEIAAKKGGKVTIQFKIKGKEL